MKADGKVKRILYLHWNELSFPQDVSAADLETNTLWPDLAKSAFDSFFRAQQLRSDIRISFSRGVFHEHIAGRSFLSWLEQWLGKERVQKLKARALQPLPDDHLPVVDLECELSVNERPGEGITRAHLADSWSWSLGVSKAGAADESIRALKTTIHDRHDSTVSVRNIASPLHGERWAKDLTEWGLTLSSNNIITEIDRLVIIMYPLDHGHPHVHVHNKDIRNLNAKYRIDKYEALTNRNPDGLDAFMELWIEEHREVLLHSWARCKAGQFPLKL